MNWEAVGAIGELVGAVGVIATLGYLAVQVRQNTRAIRGATLNLITQHQQNELRWSADMAPVMRRILEAPDELTADEAWRASEFWTAALTARENEYSQYVQGLLSERDWQRCVRVLGILMGAEWARDWWFAYGREPFADDFVAVVEKVISDGGYDVTAAMQRIKAIEEEAE